MSKPATNSPVASRPPVDAIQYEKLALAAFRMCDQHSEQLDKIVTLVASIYRNPAVMSDERKRQRTLLGLLVDTAEDYQHNNGPDRELFEVIALDAKGIAHKRLTASHAADLLASAVRRASEVDAPHPELTPHGPTHATADAQPTGAPH